MALINELLVARSEAERMLANKREELHEALAELTGQVVTVVGTPDSIVKIIGNPRKSRRWEAPMPTIGNSERLEVTGPVISMPGDQDRLRVDRENIDISDEHPWLNSIVGFIFRTEDIVSLELHEATSVAKFA